MSKIIVISGPSGAGKNSVAEVLRNNPDFDFIVSCTDRPMRSGEREGLDYHFLAPEQFTADVEAGEFLEWEPVHQNRYGTKRADVKKILDSGKNAVALLDVRGAMHYKEFFPDQAITIFITPPSIEEALKRLKDRGSDDAKSIEIRRQRYQMELSYQDRYDHVIINDDLKRAQEELSQIVGS